MVGIIASMMVSPVAPHWGAWIEMASFTPSATRQKSHPTGVRGLKYPARRVCQRPLHVAPHWGAWIEITRVVIHAEEGESHPTGVRGLKSRNTGRISRPIESHPTGVRGLK